MHHLAQILFDIVALYSKKVNLCNNNLTFTNHFIGTWLEIISLVQWLIISKTSFKHTWAHQHTQVHLWSQITIKYTSE